MTFRKNKGVPTEERFWSRVDKNGPIVPYVGTPCWVWIDTFADARYGGFGANKRQYLSHRFSYELHYGAIPKGMQVLHKCDIKPCVRPDHLFLGTQSDNIRDMYKKGRYVEKRPRDYGPKGENHHKAKLTTQQVLEIRELHKSGISQKEIASRYETGETNIWFIVHNLSWKHI